ncbi:MAG: alpha/beta hydrolase [Syntrophomonadaceae bacterium]|nr:alpha/beta hydrolase [Syntrophomonadaceae bacterium]
MTLHYQEYGDKNAPLMLFLHGGGVSGWMWDRQIKYFTHYHCVVPQLPEHGPNNYETKFSIKNSAKELIKLIEEKANGRKVILIGFSLGSQVVIQILSMKPNLCNYAIINSALVRPNPYLKKLLQPIIRLSFPLVKHKWFSKLQAKTLYISDDYFEEYYRESRQMKLDTLIRVLEENISFEIPEGFKKANGEILVTVGEKENAVMKKSAKDLINSNSNCTGVIIPGVGHGISLAMPDFFNNMTEKWIQNGELPNECKCKEIR